LGSGVSEVIFLSFLIALLRRMPAQKIL